MSFLVAIILGLIQGLTEFLPISSSGHLSLFQNLFNFDYSAEDHLLFDVLLHLATLVSVVIVYRSELKAMLLDPVELVTGRTDTSEEGGRLRPAVRNVLLVIVATLPLALVVPFHHEFERLYTKLGFIAFAFIITGTLLYISTYFTDGRKTEKTATLLDALLVGVAQAIAVIPGLSRSGSTITMALSRGYKRSYAVAFSFILSIPAVLGSTIVTLISAFKSGIDLTNMPYYLAGMLVAGVVGYFALRFMKNYFAQRPLNYFAYYCWGIGVLTLILSLVH